MRYVFVDERYGYRDKPQRWIIACIAVSQDRWNNIDSSRRLLDTPRNILQLTRLTTLLKEICGIGVIAYADLDPTLVAADEKDGAADVEEMSRTDNAWGICLAQGVAATIKFLHISGDRFNTVHIYHDMKDLKTDHRTGLHGIMTKILTQISRSVSVRGLVDFPNPPRVGRFEYVRKASDKRLSDKFQAGTLIADYLCKQAPKFIDSSVKPPIYVKDNTQTVINTLSKFK